jgi:predicted acylesterase/phospholipase RssA
MAVLLTGALLVVSVSLLLKSHAEAKENGEVQISLMLSGGGTRAAAFAYGAMLELDRFCRVKIEDHQDKAGDKFQWRFGKAEQRGTLEGRRRACEQGTSLLENVDIISAVSGGSITAGYYKTHGPEEFFTEFPSVLKENDIRLQVIGTERPWSWGRIIRPPILLLTSAVDTIINVLSIPLFFIPIHVELTPPATMVLTDGILEPSQLEKIFDDVFFDGKTFGDLSKPQLFPFSNLVRLESQRSGNDPRLFINATDIANGRNFTFDEETFTCLGAQGVYPAIPVALAAAASSSLPGVFSPVELDKVLEQFAHGSVNYKECPLILSDRVRPPLLVDGGVGDNLGVAGVLRTVFEGKRLHPEKRAEKQFFIIVNAGTEIESSLPSLAGYVDNSFDVLIRDKTDLSRILAAGLLEEFGFQTIELRLADVITTPLIKEVASAYQRTHLAPSVLQGYATTEMQRKVLSDIERAGMLPSPEQIDALIAAGRAIVNARHDEIEHQLNQANEKQFSAVCDKISNPSKYFCWPESFRQAHLASNRIGPLLHVLKETTEGFIRQTEANRNEVVSALKKEFVQSLRKGVLAMPNGKRAKDDIDDDIDDLEHRTGTFQFVDRSIVAQTLWSLYIDSLVSRSKSISLDKRGSKLADKISDEWIKVIKELTEKLGTLNIPCAREEDSAATSGPPSLSKQVAEKVGIDPPECPTVPVGVTRSSKQVLADMTAELQKTSEVKEVADTAQYHIVLARLASRRGRIEEAKNILYAALQQYPRHEDLQTFVGWHLLITHKDHQAGAKHLRQALWIVRDHRDRIKHERELTTKADQGRVNDIDVLDKHFAIQENRIKLALSVALGTAPVDIEDNPRYVSENQIHQWELTHLPSRDGMSLLDQLTDVETRRKMNFEDDRIECALELVDIDPSMPGKQTTLNEKSASGKQALNSDRFTQEKWKAVFSMSGRTGESCAWLNQISLEHPRLKTALKGLTFNTNDYLLCEKYRADEKDSKHKTCDAGRSDRIYEEIGKYIIELRSGIREELATDLGLERAEEYAREVDEYYRTKRSSIGESPLDKSVNNRPITEQLYFWLEPESVAMRGFIMLAKNAGLLCPNRKQGIRAAQGFFREAREIVVKHFPWDQRWALRYNFFAETAKDLECP